LEIDDLLPEQRRFPNQRLVQPLLSRLYQEARTLLLVEINEHGIGVGAFQLDDIGCKIGLAGFSREIRRHLYPAAFELPHDGIASAPAEIVVDIDDRQRPRLDLVAQVVGDLGHGYVLAKGRAENVFGALRREIGCFATDDLRYLRLVGELQRGAHGARVDRPEDGDGRFIQGTLDGGSRLAGVGSGVDELELNLPAEDAARGVDLLDSQRRPILPVVADGGTCS